ncbi:aminoglycoside 6-adenylyltransferase [Clostridium sp. chh4-2]|uniref:aminoglycoside 6-adenylyltransferase n=1 Tax=Clostridium sp. chh4-2 TaxID=2067550 RepID=UPI001A9A3204|nr:aminoglycoside 6-adenylyltransferase [Clostridium sp. chh4-2]
MKMRTEKEMFDLILGTARDDERIRAVIMNGSRANKDVKKDCFQDYDIVYLVTDVRPYVKDKHWIDRFGRLMILQMPEDRSEHPYDYDSGRPFTYLMQFMDGTRIDLTLYPANEYKDNGEPAVSLLDKDSILPEFSDCNDQCYWIKPPTQREFEECCNEFWWLCPYVAKELWRNGLPMAKTLLERNIRSEFMKMLDWYIGSKHDYKVGTGKKDKYIRSYLTHEEWISLKKTYPDLKTDNIWNALFCMCTIFREKAQALANVCGYEYPLEEDHHVLNYIEHIRKLPRDAGEIF